MKRWEYMYQTLGTSPDEWLHKFNHLGVDGWELLFVRLHDGVNVAYFRREIEQPEHIYLEVKNEP